MCVEGKEAGTPWVGRENWGQPAMLIMRADSPAGLSTGAMSTSQRSRGTKPMRSFPAVPGWKPSWPPGMAWDDAVMTHSGRAASCSPPAQESPQRRVLSSAEVKLHITAARHTWGAASSVSSSSSEASGLAAVPSPASPGSTAAGTRPSAIKKSAISETARHCSSVAFLSKAVNLSF